MILHAPNWLSILNVQHRLIYFTPSKGAVHHVSSRSDIVRDEQGHGLPLFVDNILKRPFDVLVLP